MVTKKHLNSTFHMRWLRDSNVVLNVIEPCRPQGPDHLTERAGDKRPAVHIAVGFTIPGKVADWRQSNLSPEEL